MRLCSGVAQASEVLVPGGFVRAYPGSRSVDPTKGKVMCWSKYEQRRRAEQEQRKDDELLRLEAAAAAAEKRTEQLLSAKNKEREPVRS